jgi:hypothetical protein
MKYAILIISVFILGCASNKPIQTQVPVYPSIDFVLDDKTAVKIPYQGMPKQIAEMFMASVNDQKEKYSYYWGGAFYNKNSVLRQVCNDQQCTYRFDVYMSCEGEINIIFEATGTYPDLKFTYKSHLQEWDECCLPITRQPWWKRIFN